MRFGRLLLVSSALLFLVAAPGPHSPYLLAAAAAVPPAGPTMLISEFYPCALNSDEYFVITSTVDTPVLLSNWSVTDGEGVLRFTGSTTLFGRARFSVSMNSSSYERAYGTLPDIGLGDEGAHSLVQMSGKFALANSGDSLMLVAPSGEAEDCVLYGDVTESCDAWFGAPVTALRPGEVARRIWHEHGIEDTDSAADWMPFREFRYGHTDFPAAEAVVPRGMITAFTSPDSALGVFTDAVESSRDTVRLCAYELTSPELCSALLDALGRGVNVSMLVDGAPAGGISEREAAALSRLASSGARTVTVRGALSEDTVKHFSALHAKYVVVDDRSVIVTSENFVDGSLSVDGVFGTRGWGVWIDSREFADYLARLFEEDSRASRPDVHDWRHDRRYDPNAQLCPQSESRPRAGVLQRLSTSSSAVVRMFVSPDASASAPFLAPILEGASNTLIQQFQVDLTWQTRWSASPVLNPLVRSALSALARGGIAKAQFDSTWFNLERNEEVIKFFEANVAHNGLEGEFAFIQDSSPVELLHNKGLVVDGKLSVVSSNNWVYSSFAKNRELAVVIESSEIAEYFARAFQLDWYPDHTPPEARAGDDMSVKLGDIVRLSGAESVDDRCIVSWTWDTDGDGGLDAEGVEVAFTAMRPGRNTIQLTVKDSWGNTNTDEVIVEVVYAPAAREAPGQSWTAFMLPLVAAAAIAGAMFARVRTRRRLRRGPRKINHPRPNSEQRDKTKGVLSDRHTRGH